MPLFKKYYNSPFNLDDGTPVRGPIGWGMFAQNKSSSAFTTIPADSEFLKVRGTGSNYHPQITHIVARFSWRFFQPRKIFTGNNAADVYDFTELDRFLDKCNQYKIFGRIQTQYVNNGVGDSPSSSNSPCPTDMWTGFHIDNARATGPYAGGCFYFDASGTPSAATGKLWPRMWVPAVYEQYGFMLKHVLEHIREHRHGKWFAGFQFPEMALQGAKDLAANADSTLNWSEEKVFDGWRHVVNIIHETWPEPLHVLFANWSGGSNVTRYWRPFLEYAFLEKGFGWGSPDTYYGVGGSDLHAGWETALGHEVLITQKYQDRIPIIMGSQNSGTVAGTSVAKLISTLRDDNRLDNGGTVNMRANACAVAQVDGGAGLKFRDFLAYTKANPTVTLPVNKTRAVFEHTNFGGGVTPPPVTGLAAPGNLRVSSGSLLWDYATVSALKGFRVWVSATQGGTPLAGTKRFNTGSPSARGVSLASLTPPATAHWLCVQARGASAHSPIASIQVAAVTALAAPSQVCVNFGDETISWVYTNATGNPPLGFHIYVDDVLIKITGPGKRAIPRLRSTWTNATEYDVKVEAVGALGVASLTRTFTYANETTESSCTA